MTESSERLLATLAILQVNWDESHKSHLDNFVPFAVEAIRRSRFSNATESQIAAAVREHFGIPLPANVARAVLRRAEKQSLIICTDHRYGLSHSAAGDSSIAAQEQGFLRRQRNLAESLAAFLGSQTLEEWTPSQAGEALLDYVESNAPDLLARALRGVEPQQTPPSGAQGDQTLVAAWIEGISRSDPERFDYLVAIIKGSMLAAVIVLPDQGELDRPFRNTSLILDTPLVLRRLGYEGAESEQATRETLALAIRQGADIACLQKTVTEARSILQSAAQGIGRTTNSPPRPLDSYFAKRGLTRAQALMLAEQLEPNIISAGISIITPPPADALYTVDEKALENELARHVHPDPTRREALLHDLDALAAIHRLRANEDGDRLETCRAVLVTRNVGLVKVARNFPDFGGHRWPLAMTNDHLSTMLWVKRPLAAPDLPRHQLLAKCYSLLSPSESVWSKYLDQIERLRSGSELSDNDVLLLKYTQEAQRALVQATAGRGGQVARDTVLEIRRQVVEELRAPERAAAQRAQQEAELAGADAATAREKQEAATRSAADAIERETEVRAALQAEQQARIELEEREQLARTRIRTRANRIGRSAVAAIGLILVVITWLALSQDTGPWKWLGSGIVAILTVIGGLSDWGKTLQQLIAKRYEDRILGRIGFKYIARAADQNGSN